MAEHPIELRELFCEALDRTTPHDREAFLDEACAGRPSLRGTLEKLLRAQSEAGQFLEEPPDRAVDVAPGPGDISATVLGNYRLGEQIGEGGFGLVFVAEQLQPVRRQVAVKILKPGMGSREVIARFEAERQALALMDHPNIARVFDAGTVPGEPGRLVSEGRPYFVMELFRGVPITEFCDQHRLTTRQRLNLFETVGLAVQHAHQKGIIHRDIKPSNVLVAPRDGAPMVKVIDFGIAKALGRPLTDTTPLTSRAQLVGTPPYMSPEQADIGCPDIDTRSDVYSLGVLLYELLTGVTPFSKDRLRHASFDEMRRILREEEPPAPSTRVGTLGAALTTVCTSRQSEPKQLSRLLRGELDWIAMKALDKDRARRYESASAFAADIERYLDNQPVAAGPPTASYRLRKFVRRHRVGLGTAAAVLLSVLLAGSGLGWVVWDRAEQNEARRLEEARRWTDTERMVSLALAKAEQLAEQAGHLPSATSTQTGVALVIWRQAADALAPAEAALSTGADDDVLRQRVAAARERLQQGQQLMERAQAYALRKEKLLRDLDEARMARSVLTDNQLDNAGAAAKYAAAFLAYDLDVAATPAERLLAQIAAIEPEVREVLVVALEDWAFAVTPTQNARLAERLRGLAAAADNDPWRQRYRAAVAADDGKALNALAAEAKQLALPASSCYLLAMTLVTRGDREAALDLLRWGRARHATDFWLHFQLGTMLNVAGAETTALEVEEAIGSYRTALALRPRTAMVHNNLGSALKAKKRWDEAIAEFRKAIEIEPKAATVYFNLGTTFGAKGNPGEALAAYKKAIELDPRMASAHNNLGMLLQAKKQLNEAIAEFRAAIDLNPKHARAYVNLGNALKEKNQLDDAIAAYNKAIEIDPRLAPAHNNLGNALRLKNKLDQALAEYQKAVELDPNYALAYVNLGAALKAKNQLDGAIVAYQKAIELDPKHVVANDLGTMFHVKNQWDDAIAAFRKAIDINPKFAPAYHNLGTVLQDKNQLDDAVAAYRKAVELDPQFAAAHIGLGTALLAKKQPDEAIVVFKKAIEVNPKNALAYNNLGVALRTKNQRDEAIAAFKKAIHLDPTYASAHNNLGMALQDGNQMDEAIAEYRKAIDVAPAYAPAYYNLGVALQAKGQLDEASAAYNKAIDLSPRASSPHYNLGTILHGKNQLEEAIAEYKKAIELDPKHANSRLRLGQALLEKGQFAEAKATTLQATKLVSTNDSQWPFLSHQMARVDRLLALEAKLSAFLAGQAQPGDNQERLGMIEVCRLQRRWAAAARLFGDAFTADALLAEDRKAGHRWIAACTAALAAGGQGIDADRLDDKERARLRQQALTWLRAELEEWSKVVKEGNTKDREAAGTILRKWQREPDLVRLREMRDLMNLPPDEATAWRDLWADVAELAAKSSAGNER